MHGLVPCMSTENLHSANSLLVDNLSRLFYLLPKYFFQSKCISSNVSFMFLHSAGLIQVRMDLVLAHTFHSISSNISYPNFKCSFILRVLSKSEWLIFFPSIHFCATTSQLHGFPVISISLSWWSQRSLWCFRIWYISLKEKSYTRYTNQYQYFC